MKFIPFLAVLVLFASCQNSIPKFVSTSDTVVAAYREKKDWRKAPTNLYIGTYSTYQKKVYTDSPSVSVSYITAYNWKVKLSDTLKDIKGQPVYDSAHHVIQDWRQVPDSSVKYLQIITVGD